jgi:hypothetical protein
MFLGMFLGGSDLFLDRPKHFFRIGIEGPEGGS